MLARPAQRVVNGLRKVMAGLRPFGESVWPGVRNDLFVAHESIYRFASAFARDANVLDAGCGTGYGSLILVEAGARHVLGVDIDPLSIAFARRRFATSTLGFERADCQDLTFPQARFDLVFASNVLEHLERPERFVATAFNSLRPGGLALFAVPPITSVAMAALHRDIHYHRSNLTVPAWRALLTAHAWTVTAFTHTFVGSGTHPDFASPFPSALSPSAFAFAKVPAEDLANTPTITALFLAARAAKPLDGQEVHHGTP
jgi:2-polyprenyl-3-methyl-5-hydroxy-6-metoxy-1,4-benzoquinol methylase